MSPRRLGIRAGEKWALLEGAKQPLRPALVTKPGTHYDALVRIKLLDDPEQGSLWVPRRKLPCRWEERNKWLDEHPHHRVPDSLKLAIEPAPDPIAVPIDALRRAIREEIEAAVSPPPVAYSLADAARAIGVSEATLRRAVRGNRLVANYIGRKPIFRVEELQRWVRSLPTDPPGEA